MNSLEISENQFRQLADRITEVAANYLHGLDSRPIAPATSGEESARLFESALPDQGLGEQALNALSAVIDSSRAQNARFFGYVLGSGEPVGAVADFLASV